MPAGNSPLEAFLTVAICSLQSRRLEVTSVRNGRADHKMKLYLGRPDALSSVGNLACYCLTNRCTFPSSCATNTSPDRETLVPCPPTLLGSRATTSPSRFRKIPPAQIF
jgi:hypothetical protein